MIALLHPAVNPIIYYLGLTLDANYPPPSSHAPDNPPC